MRTRHARFWVYLELFGALLDRSISVQEDVLAEALARFGPRFERQMRISLGKLAERVGMPPYCLVDFLVEKKTY